MGDNDSSPFLRPSVFSRCLPLLTGLVVLLLFLPAGTGAAAAPPLRIGVLAVLGAEATIQEWSPVLRQLQTSLPGYQVSLTHFDHEGLRAAARRGELDFVITNPGHYIELEAELGASRILSLDAGSGRSPQSALGSTVIVRRDSSPLRRLEDLRGRRLAVVSHEAFGGYQMLWGELLGLGIDPEQELAGLHEVGLPMNRVIEALEQGQADAGVLRSCMLESRPDWMARYRVLSPREIPGFPCASSTRLYPDWPLAALRHTPPEHSRAVAIALLGMTQEKHGMAWSMPADYQSVHELFRKLEIGPYAYLRSPGLRHLAERYWPWMAGMALLILAWVLYTLRVEHLVHVRTRALREALAARDASEQRMRAAQEQAEHLSRLSVLGELSGTLAHELNQPLATITNYAGSLRRRADNQRLTEAAVREAAGEIADQAERAAGIMARIRGFSRKRVGSCAPVAPGEVVQEAITLFQGMLARAPRVEVDDRLPAGARIGADRLQLQQVLLNLLKNAWDASQELPPERQQILVSLEDAGDNIRLGVRDLGCGLDATTRAQLFQPFFTTKPDGLGLGLSICRSIAEAHGGHLTAEHPASGPGARFVLTLPKSDAAPGPVQDITALTSDR